MTLTTAEGSLTPPAVAERTRTSHVPAGTRVAVKDGPTVYGYDLLAWALHAQGRDVEAKAAMTHALAQGTRDAQLFYHAAVIERALGDETAASEFFARARTLQPPASTAASEAQ